VLEVYLLQLLLVDTAYNVKRSKVKVTRPLLSPRLLTHQAAAAVSVRTYWEWETTATLRCARRR